MFADTVLFFTELDKKTALPPIQLKSLDKTWMFVAFSIFIAPDRCVE